MDMYMDNYPTMSVNHHTNQLAIPMSWDEVSVAEVQATPSPNAVYVKDLERAINDELHAIHFYAKLIELAPEQNYKQRIANIRQDEIRHYHQLYRHYMQLTGKHPQLQPGKIPQDFESGLHQAIEDELQAVAFYQRMMLLATEPRVRNMWMHLSNDEQRHASLLMLSAMQYRGSGSGGKST